MKRLFVLAIMALLFLPTSVNALSFSTELAATVDTTTGTVINGTFVSTHAVDGTDYQVEEVIGTPGFLIVFTFTTVGDSVASLSLYGYYDGNPAHNVEGQLYNWNSADWDMIDIYPDAVADAWYNVTVGSSDYVSNNQITFRIVQTTTGVAGHDFYIDYLEVGAVDSESIDETTIFYQLFLSLEMWGYLGPIGLVIIGAMLAKQDKILGVFWFIVECLFASQYFELVDATPQYWWHIFIILLGGLFTCVFPLIGHRKS